MSPNRIVLALWALPLSLLASGCAAFSDYNDDTRKARASFEAGDTQTALERLEKNKDNELDGLCFTLERGVIAQAGGNYALSQSEFERAAKKIEEFEDRGLSAKGVAQQAGRIFLNDKTVPYEGEAFEKILVPVMNARNYALQGNLEDAMVEVRRTYFEQDRAKQLHEKELDSAQSEAKSRHVSNGDFGNVRGQVEYPPGALASPESVYEVTYAHYLSGLIAERMGNLDDARISYEAALKIRPDLAFLRQDLSRIKRGLGDDDGEGGGKSKAEGSVALLFDCGWAPWKKELKVIFPTYHSLGAVAIPVYERSQNPAARARLVLGSKSATTAVLSDVEAIAFKYHRDRMPYIVLRQAIRLAVKVAEGEATAQGVKAAVKSGQGRKGRNNGTAEVAGWAAGLVVGAVNAATEQADLRAWRTLPQSFQAVRVSAPPGEYEARIELLSGGGGVLASADLGTVKVAAGKMRFAFARSVGSTLYASLEAPGAASGTAPARRRGR